MYRKQSTIVYCFFLVLGVNSYYLYPPYYYGPYSFKPVPVSENAHFALQRTKSQELSSDNNVTSLDLGRLQYWGPIHTFLARVCVNTNSCPVAAPLCQQCSACPICPTTSTTGTIPAPVTGPSAGSTCPVAPDKNEAIDTCGGISVSPEGTIKYTKTALDGLQRACTYNIVTFKPLTKITAKCASPGGADGLIEIGSELDVLNVRAVNEVVELTTKLMVIRLTITELNPVIDCSWKAS